MAGMNGADVLILANTGTPTVPAYTAVGSQRDCSIAESTAIIDTSSKDARERRILPGRYQATLNLDELYVPSDAAYNALLDAMRNGDMILIAVQEQGATIETLDAVIASLTRNFPDQQDSTVSFVAEVDGAITELGT